MRQVARVECAQLSDQLERSFRGGAWHGPAVLELLAGLAPGDAAWRPYPGAHSIAELVGHLAFWVRDTGRRLQGAGPLDTGLDWAAGDPWPAPLEGLAEAHGALLAALRDLDDARLGDAVPGQDPTFRDLLLGLLQHNAYHAGQLASLRKAAAHASGGGA